MVRGLYSIMREAALNNRSGMWAWILQRLTGLALAAYLIPHLIVLASARGGATAFDQQTAGIQTPIWHLFDIGLLAVFLIHGANGIRVVAVDTVGQSRKQVMWMRAVAAVALAVFIIGAVSIAGKMFAD